MQSIQNVPNIFKYASLRKAFLSSMKHCICAVIVSLFLPHPQIQPTSPQPLCSQRLRFSTYASIFIIWSSSIGTRLQMRRQEY